MIRLLPLMGIACTLFASDSSRLYELYQSGEYVRACDEGIKKLGYYQKDERYISLYAFACLYADKIDRLALPIIMLKNNPESRKNATYFSVVLTQKNLLISGLENGQDLTSLNLPMTDHILSKIFVLYSRGDYINYQGKIRFKDNSNKHISYTMQLLKEENPPRLVIDTFYDTIMTKRHFFR